MSYFFFYFFSNSFADLQFKQSKDISDDTDDLRGIFIKPDGTRVYVNDEDDATPTVIEYSLTTPFDISTATKTSQTNNSRCLVVLRLWISPHAIDI